MTSRFTFALENVRAAHWEQFENLATQFLGDEFGSLRVLANPSGDRGRDAMLWQPEGESQVAIQYSVAKDWERKVKGTVTRLKTTNPQVTILVFLTPHAIGAAADNLQQEIRKSDGIHLDIRDQHWFTTREERTASTVKAAGWFSDYVLRHVMPETGFAHTPGVGLTNEETRAALLYLVLQREDDDLERHLTKLCYDALVRTILRDTDNDNRKSRDQIHAEAYALLATHPEDQVGGYVDRALDRMNKRNVRHWQRYDEFCLTHEERERIAEAIASLRISDGEFENELWSNAEFVAQGLDVDISLADRSQVTERIRRVLETFLFERGEAFVTSVSSGQGLIFVEDELESIVESDVAAYPDASSLRGSLVPLVTRTVERALLRPSSDVQGYLRAVADAYTLFAFLMETPNVQSGVTKLFANGEIWLDTSALLPVFAESLLDAHERSYTHLIDAVTDAGAHLYVTRGVLEEISSHVDLSLLAARLSGTWNSRTPFLLATYLWAGYTVDGFPAWIENFKGHSRPIDDLQEYLEEGHGIRTRDLVEEYESAEENIRWQADGYWQEVHERRRRGRGGASVDPEVVRQLAQHDSENFVGVLQRRSGEQIGNPFGYATWWLSLDRYAFSAAQEIADRCGLDRLDSPVLSFDFLTYYLAVGPARRRLEKSRESQLPLIMDTSLTNSLPKELLRMAEEVRASMAGQPERVIRRRVRDHLDAEKLRGDRVGRTTLEAIEEDIRSALQTTAARRK